jgi:uncharacterized protein (TIGR02453 family)
MLFSGFPKESIEFFKNLRDNNNKIWFNEHKPEYKLLIEEPFKELVSALSPTMLEIDPEFEVEPKVGKTISRIYRDVRFSKDKSPYRSNMWLSFKLSHQNWKEFPGYFFDLSIDHFMFGMGCYQATKPTMDNLRAMIDEEPDYLRENLAFIREETDFEIKGEMYKKILNPNAPEDLKDLYQMKNLYLMSESPMDEIIFNGEIADLLISEFEKTANFYNLLKSVI